LFIGLVACELLLSPLPWVYQSYSPLIGLVGLSIEATQPNPQIIVNQRSRSSKGLRFSVLVSWLVGDTMKMFWFFTSTTSIPWAFKVCGMFQAFCDALLGVQYFMYGREASKAQAPDRQYELQPQPNGFTTASVHDNLPGRRTSTTEKAI
jgi:hypothetical protein